MGLGELQIIQALSQILPAVGINWLIIHDGFYFNTHHSGHEVAWLIEVHLFFKHLEEAVTQCTP